MPQGSVSGPLLFLVHINDLPNSILSSIKIFADDCVIYRNACTNIDTNFLQQDRYAVFSGALDGTCDLTLLNAR